MDPKELKSIFQRGKCLSLENMRMYNEGTLSSKAAHEVEKHLIECTLCASAIEGLNKTRITDVTKVSTNIHKRLAVYMNTPPQTPILSRFGVAMIVSSLVVVIGLTTWFLTRSNEAPKRDIADSGAVQHQPPSEEHSFNEISEPGSVERSQENGAVSVLSGPQPDAHGNLPQPVVAENPPLTQPNDKTPSPPALAPQEEPKAQPPAPEENTRVAQADQYLRIKSVVIYPPTTHTDKKPKSNDGGGGNGQLNRSQNTKAQFELEDMPTYPGGNEALKAYILNNYRPQKEDKDNLKRKTTGVLFQVNAKTGEVSGASLSFMISPLTDAELMRVIEAMPAWNPGPKRGTVDVMLGITFE